MVIEENGVREVAHIIEASFGSRLFGARVLLLDAGSVSLPAGRNNAADERKEEECGGDDSDLVSLPKLSGAIRQRVGAGDNRTARQVTTDVFRELFDRSVTARGLFSHCHANDVVEIAAQPAGVFGAAHDRARFLDLRGADRLLDFRAIGLQA